MLVENLTAEDMSEYERSFNKYDKELKVAIVLILGINTVVSSTLVLSKDILMSTNEIVTKMQLAGKLADRLKVKIRIVKENSS